MLIKRDRISSSIDSEILFWHILSSGTGDAAPGPSAGPTHARGGWARPTMEIIRVMNATRRLLPAMAIAGLVCALAGPARASVILETFGTATPPTTAGGFTLTSVADAAVDDFTPVTSLASPTGGLITFDPATNKRTVPGSWNTWSHGYTGPVYFLDGTSLTIGLPVSTAAFRFDAEPNFSGSFTFTATANDGSSISQLISGDSGASGFSLYTTAGSILTSVTLTSASAGGFAVGELAIAAAVVPTPEPTTLAMAASALPVGLGLWLRRRRKATVA